MRELYIIQRKDTNQYYYSLTPRGYPIWVDTSEHAQLLTEDEAENIVSLLNYAPYKHVLSYELA